MSVVPRITRIEIAPIDTEFLVGDTVTFRAVSYGDVGQPVPTAVIGMRVREVRTQKPDGNLPAAFGHVYPVGPHVTHSPTNTFPVRALRAGRGYVVAEVIGLADSVRISSADKRNP
jgi:hypothetical protein